MENDPHVQRWLHAKHAAQARRARDCRTQTAAPSAARFKRASVLGESLASGTEVLMSLLESLSAAALQASIDEAMACDLARPHAARLAVERAHEAVGLRTPCRGVGLSL